MSQLKERLKTDLKSAMVSKDTFKRDTIRFLMSAIKQIEVDERVELDDQAIGKIIQKSIKQREDAAAQYKEANRDDLYDKEIKEAAILKEYLPKQLDENELKEIVQEVIKSTGASGMKDMGKVVKTVLEKVGSSSDGKSVSNLVKQLLN